MRKDPAPIDLTGTCVTDTLNIPTTISQLLNPFANIDAICVKSPEISISQQAPPSLVSTSLGDDGVDDVGDGTISVLGAPAPAPAPNKR